MMDASFEDAEVLIDELLPIGATLSGDQFTITGHLGAGGFGVTYRAKDNVLGRTIVIKECFPAEFCVRHGLNAVPRGKPHADPMRSIVRMFMHEARSLAKLRHPNIVGVHRAFEENNTAYMALDLIEGQDLFDLLEASNAALPPARVRDILMQLLNAIEKVHDIGILHRDISPDNILIEADGTPVLIDFGAARADPTRHTRAASSLLVVKDGYSPQEFYVPGREHGPSSDLYALGATFYHVLSGEAPPDSQARMLEIAGNRPDPCIPLAGRISGYDPDFLRAIDTAMAVHPGDRLQSAAKWRSLIARPEPRTDDQGIPAGDFGGVTIPLNLELSLSRLVEETNDEVRRTSQLRPQSKPAVQPVRNSSRPEWVEEFNEGGELANNADRIDKGPAPSSASAGSNSSHGAKLVHSKSRARGETNWVDRAKKKDLAQRSQSRDLNARGAAPAESADSGDAAPVVVNPYDWNAPVESSAGGKAKVAGVFLCLFLSIYMVATFEGPASKTADRQDTANPRVNSLQMNGSIVR